MARVTYVTVKMRIIDGTRDEAVRVADEMVKAVGRKASHVETTIKEDGK